MAKDSIVQGDTIYELDGYYVRERRKQTSHFDTTIDCAGKPSETEWTMVTEQRYETAAEAAHAFYARFSLSDTWGGAR